MALLKNKVLQYRFSRILCVKILDISPLKNKLLYIT